VQKVNNKPDLKKRTAGLERGSGLVLQQTKMKIPGGKREGQNQRRLPKGKKATLRGQHEELPPVVSKAADQASPFRVRMGVGMNASTTLGHCREGGLLRVTVYCQLGLLIVI